MTQAKLLVDQIELLIIAHTGGRVHYGDEIVASKESLTALVEILLAPPVTAPPEEVCSTLYSDGYGAGYAQGTDDANALGSRTTPAEPPSDAPMPAPSGGQYMRGWSDGMEHVIAFLTKTIEIGQIGPANHPSLFALAGRIIEIRAQHTDLTRFAVGVSKLVAKLEDAAKARIEQASACGRAGRYAEATLDATIAQAKRDFAEELTTLLSSHDATAHLL